ncbi:glutathione S-transferase family protein [Sphingomonas corticis]|jgi:glutathione S-transferase|uniref:Glutathione S-transferase n=1 Tax=Sphingomonas corticis TaxID=2722791 RepID=A0ABX1CVL3_9SPHN|nr:glutathione S-transferase N-terminal domain-containing protein [Sphingomonas corticis]NJR79937.1 glutathione S-transferase [Sphingomonas corticis]
MKLYDAAWAPSPRRVRMYLAEKAIQVERVTIDLRGDEHLSPAYLAINPRGTVPALVLDDGEVIAESAAICRFFEALHPDPPLFGARAAEIARVEDWTRRIEAEGYAAAVYALRNRAPAFMNRGLPGAWPAIPQIPALTQRAQAMFARFVAGLDARLGEAEWIAGERYSFADITALATIDFARAAKLAVPAEATGLARWHAAASARPSAAA